MCGDRFVKQAGRCRWQAASGAAKRPTSPPKLPHTEAAARVAAAPRSTPRSQHAQLTRDSLAEWSKALAQGASPQGRGFEPHSCHSCAVAAGVRTVAARPRPHKAPPDPSHPPAGDAQRTRTPVRRRSRATQVRELRAADRCIANAAPCTGHSASMERVSNAVAGSEPSAMRRRRGHKTRHGTCGLVAMTSASHAEGRQFDPGQVYAQARAVSNACACGLAVRPNLAATSKCAAGKPRMLWEGGAAGRSALRSGFAAFGKL